MLGYFQHLFNIFGGIVIGILLYVTAFNKLNVAVDDTHWFLFPILFVSTFCTIFTAKQEFRCTSLVTLTGTLSKQGINPLATFLLTMLMNGPMRNMIVNFEKASESAICHMQLANELTFQRVHMLTGPIEEHLRSEFGLSTKLGRDALKAVKKSIDPFAREIQTTDEDALLWSDHEKSLALLERMNQLRNLSDEKPSDKLVEKSTVAPEWTKLKSKSARKLARRMQLRCDYIFTHAVSECYDQLADIKEKCYQSLFWPVSSFACPALDVISLCAILEQKNASSVVCSQTDKDPVITSDFDVKMQRMDNITNDLDKEILLNLHLLFVEKPRVVRIRQLQSIKIHLSLSFNMLKHSFNILLAFLRILLLVQLLHRFKNASLFVGNYLRDIRFENHFLTANFWRIDLRRKNDDVDHVPPYLYPLTRWEKRKFGLKDPVSLWTINELKETIFPLFKWFILALIVTVIIAVDYYFYDLLRLVSSFGMTTVEHSDQGNVKLTVKGDGFLANLTREMLAFNYSQIMETDQSNAHCLVKASPPDWSLFWLWLFIPLLFMFWAQVVLNYLPSRLRLFVCSCVYPCRQKVRTVWLYNKLLYERFTWLATAKEEIRRKFLQRNIIENASQIHRNWTDENIWPQFIIDFFPFGKCLLCHARYRPKNLEQCQNGNCRATFCLRCWKQMGSLCCACTE